MRKYILLISCLIVGIVLTGCKSVEKEILGSWYCEDTNILLTFYGDKTMDRDLLDFDSYKDGTYRWYIDEEKRLKISNLEGETMLTMKFEESFVNDESDWSLEDSLKLGVNTYIKTTDQNVSSDDASPHFYENYMDINCVVYYDENVTEMNLAAFHSSLEQMDGVISIEYTSPDEAWESFLDEYFAGNEEEAAAAFGDDNPLANSGNTRVCVESRKDLEELEAYLKGSTIVRKVQKSCTIKKNVEPLL